MKRIPHLVASSLDANNAAAEAGNVVDGRLECAMIRSDDVGIGVPHGDKEWSTIRHFSPFKDEIQASLADVRRISKGVLSRLKDRSSA